MLLNLIEYHWAEHIDDALLLLGRLDMKTVPLAGGTYLLGLQDESIQAVVDLRELGLSYISDDARAIHIGAMTTLQTIVDAPLLQQFASGLLPRAAQASSSSRLIRNSATIGGTIGAGVASQADLLTALVAMNAEIVVRSGSKTQVNLSGGTFERPGLALSGVVFKGKQERRIPVALYGIDKRPNELIVEIVIPRPAQVSGTAFARIGRTPTDVALLNTAALVEIEDGVYKRVQLAFGGANMEVMRMHTLEQLLTGQPVGNPVDTARLLAAIKGGLERFRPPADLRASTGYRCVSAVNLAYHVLEEAISASHRRSPALSGKGA